MLRKKTCLILIFALCVMAPVFYLLSGNFRHGGYNHARERSGMTGIFPETVILISMDTLRADRLGLYGHERETAPRLSKLAEDSVTFATAAAQATQTLVSHKSLLSAKYPLRMIRETTNADMEVLAARKKATAYLTNTLRKADNSQLVSKLRENGYRTAAFVDGGWMGRLWGFRKGFGKFKSSGDGFEDIIPRVTKWVEENREHPFFLFVHSYDVHCPYPCREPFNSRYCTDHSKHILLEGKCPKTDLRETEFTEYDYAAVENHYEGGISSADAHIGVLIDKLVELGLYDEALIVVTSDHGESLGEAGRLGHGGLFLEQILVPLLIKPPASSGIVFGINEEPVELVDVMPTILDICGIAPPSGLDGRSLLHVMKKLEKGRDYLITQTTYNEWEDGESRITKRSLLVPGLWFLVNDNSSSATELYNLRADPECRHEMSACLPGETEKLLSILALHDPGAGSGRIIEPEETEIPDELREELESIGYITD